MEAVGLGLDLSLPGFGLFADCSVYMWFMGLNCWWCCTVHSNYCNTFLLILVLLAFYLSQDVQICSIICSQLRLHLGNLRAEKLELQIAVRRHRAVF